MSPAADVVCVRRSAEDEFLILATDGVWDVLSNQASKDTTNLEKVFFPFFSSCWTCWRT